MILSTTSSLDGKKITEYKGIVFGEFTNGINFVKDFTASISNLLGGRAVEYEQELIKSRASAINEMIQRAQNIGANAIVGIKIDYETIGENSSMIMVIASGTAVVVE